MMGLVGIVALLLVAYIASENRSRIRWRTVGGAFAIQLAIGAFVLYIPFGKDVLLSMSAAVSNVIQYANEGIKFLFGDMGRFVFAINVLTVIIFFSSLIAVLYHIGVMKFVINIIGGGLQKLLGTSRPESMSAAGNIFVGQTEAPLVVKPFIPSMTRSELFAVMVGGLASVAGSVLAGYALLGIEMKYLIAASFMAAPGGLLMAKILIPETDQPKNELNEISTEKSHTNLIDAAAAGASSGMQLALNVGAMLLAFVGLIALVNGIVGGIGNLIGFEGLTLQLIFGYVFQPLAFILGVSWDEARAAGSFIGQKLVINEFVAYLDFVQVKEQLSAHTQVIVTIALCGFANFSSIAILLGGLGGMAPSRRADIAELGLKALLAATLANLMSAAIAGFFFYLG
ncbi:NupC/NupG family nucleoside CNT transporter [Alishewanella sp. 16-MA]|uniref:Nucleoside permease n=1 Tax=Alishewanella maricola TaxID=2795740 RepID=A0ABS8C7B9_9ALTE|nr:MULTISPECIES: NupC/NupG family nucleoside CNT transporter [Alishewanella]MDP4944711.1 NupC/NupG family nucleoside CNT transporter [Alishewanella sp.]MCB5228241.1 NupC/NupG family nucleoside CNT transporter [Alishewanella maricola]MDP5037185.1 NupC/NupG family nucleoside CNT transporter [Alishewanella sp.]MDP5186094.1 NupC/NupG family nucleoside CNT transporter [Alishewanella sp.]MDP5459277.1 NupC/NupG family nucleoside CNT transporter [Alishewanella sp. SMS8]